METADAFFGKLHSQQANNKPFVVYAKPGQQEVAGIFQRDAATYLTTTFAEPGFVFAAFDGNDNYLIPENASDVLVCDAADFGIANVENPTTEENPQAKAAFESLVSKGIDAIKHGLFGKVVLSRKEEVHISNLDAIAVFRKLLQTYPNAFRYFWFHPATGLWMGATPEQLIRAKDKQFNTVALAGTQPYNGTEEVEWQEKEIAEQQFVTDFISESLMNNVAGMTFSDSYTAKAGNLLHIKTDIEGTLHEDLGLKPILDILHPTPAVCGFPKAEAKQFILENEGYDREFYSGFLGEINKDFVHDKKGSELYVNLRCMKIDGDDAHLYMGCGITKDSNPEKEFTETVNKSLTMKKVLLCN